MNQTSGNTNRSKERGIHWGAVALGWVVAVAAGILIGAALGGLHNLVAGRPLGDGEVTIAAVIISLLTGFLSYLAGGYAAGRLAGASGGLNGAMTAVFGLVVGIVLGLALAVLGLIAFGVEWPPAVPAGFGRMAGGAFLAGLVLFRANLLGGRRGQSSRA